MALKIDAKSQRSLVPLEVCKVEWCGIGRCASCDLNIPSGRDPEALGKFGVKGRPDEKRLTGDAVEAESVMAPQVARLCTDQNARLHLCGHCRREQKAGLVFPRPGRA